MKTSECLKEFYIFVGKIRLPLLVGLRARHVTMIIVGVLATTRLPKIAIFISDNFRSLTTLEFKPPNTQAESWDLYERGPRVFVYKQGLSKMLSNLASTLFLFEPCLTTGVGDMFAKANLDFLRDNAGIIMEPRPEGVPEILPIDKELIMNGDTFDIMRLDGLDPMIAWAQGAATGHTAIALWKDGQVVYF